MFASGVGSTVNLFSEEASFRMTVAGDGDEFPDTAAALVITLAMQYKVHGFAGLRPDKSLVQIRSRAQSHIREPVESVHGGIRVQRGKRPTMAGVHRLEQ